MPDVEVLMVRSAPLNDPIELRLDANNVTLRRKEAQTIEIHEETENDE
jgi:ferrous iron transport protein A